MATKILPFGVMVIDGDTHVSRWVEQEGRLRIAEKYLKPFRKYVPVGGTVVDAGAMIGDHTATYADWVGPEGSVICFEPNPEAFECLKYNIGTEKAELCDQALSDKYYFSSLVISDNAGASYLCDKLGAVQTIQLDGLKLNRLDFLKLDIEGFETRALRGARETIARLRPVMLIEVNEGALIRAGSSREELLKTIRGYDYWAAITEKGLSFSDPQYDVICLP